MFWLARIKYNKGKDKSMTPSLTIGGLVVILIGFLLERFDVKIAPGEIQSFINVGAQIVGLIMAYIGRMRQGDLTPLGFKK